VRSEELAFWATPGPLTDLRGVRRSSIEAIVDDLPDEPAEITRLVSGLILHRHLLHLYGFTPSTERFADLESRSAAELLDTLFALDGRPLSAPRSPAQRAVGVCRHFVVLACALLRAKGLPARARCGFNGYFDRTRFLDHWIVEVWDARQHQWVIHDPQLDDRQRPLLVVAVEPTDVPSGVFITGAAAWRRCREGLDDPLRYGILDWWGMPFIRGNLVRDLAALNKVELLPWDVWGVIEKPYDADDHDMLATMDVLADLVETAPLDDIRRAYETTPGVRVGSTVRSLEAGRLARVPELS